MLTAESERIRNLVRFDARYSGQASVCSHLQTLEEYSSQLIADRSFSIVNYLAETERGIDTRALAASVRSRSRARIDLGIHLAVAHQRSLKKHEVVSPIGTVARAQIRRAMKELGLLTATCIPLSVVLSRTVRRYESAARDRDTLAEFLTKSLDLALGVGEKFAAELSALLQVWSESVRPRPGTVLAAAFDQLRCEGSLRPSQLRNQTMANKSNVYRAIGELESAGIVREVTGRKKDQIWVAQDLADLIVLSVDRPI